MTPKAEPRARSTIDVRVIAARAIHGRGQRVRAVTLDETPRGAAKMHASADAPPMAYVIGEFEGCRVVGHAQYKATIGTCYRLEWF
jgi:hypothetical protein